MHYLVAYDIADPRRLRRVARFLERHAVRLQKSVFLFKGNTEAMEGLLDEITPILKIKEDVVQAWQLSSQQPVAGLIRGTPLNSHPNVAVLDGAEQHLISKSV